MGKTRDLFKRIRNAKEIFHAKMATIKDRNSKDLKDAEEIKKRWQEYVEELFCFFFKVLMMQITTMVWSLTYFLIVKVKSSVVKKQYCIVIWNVRSMNQGKLGVVKQEMARVNINILAISELKWREMGKFNSNDHCIYYCGQESLRRNGVALHS